MRGSEPIDLGPESIEIEPQLVAARDVDDPLRSPERTRVSPVRAELEDLQCARRRIDELLEDR